MFERFTHSARQVVVLAQAEASSLDHRFIGTEHLLLALLAEGHGAAAQVLADLGLAEATTRRAIVDMVGAGPLTQPDPSAAWQKYGPHRGRDCAALARRAERA